MNLFAANTVAGAVAREINRLAEDPFLMKSEGAAYKAAWDRAGSPWEKHCAAVHADCHIFAVGVFCGQVLNGSAVRHA